MQATGHGAVGVGEGVLPFGRERDDGQSAIVAVPTPVDIAHNPDFTPLIGASDFVGRHMKKGAIVVYWRGTKASGLGHVGFYRGENATSIWTLGGNESDMVEIAALAKAGVLSVGAKNDPASTTATG